MYPPARKPCGECPWRRSSWAGYLGPLTADEWIALAHSDGSIACHCTLDEDDDPYARHCAGADIYRSNVLKVPRRLDHEQLPADHDAVFSSPAEFKRHHGGADAPAQGRRAQGAH